jgi:hypothetical protein
MFLRRTINGTENEKRAIGDKAEQAYRRSDALEKRRKLMEAWAAYCEPRTGNVVPLARAKDNRS